MAKKDQTWLWVGAGLLAVGGIIAYLVYGHGLYSSSSPLTELQSSINQMRGLPPINTPEDEAAAYYGYY